MEESLLVRYSRTNNIQLNYDLNKKGHWISFLGVGNLGPYFISESFCGEIKESSNVGLLNKLEEYDFNLFNSLIKNGIYPLRLKEALFT